MSTIEDILNDIDEIDGDGEILSETEIEQGDVIEVNNENGEEVKKEENDDEKPVKKVRKRSIRPLLNAERLKGTRGLICMEKTFSELKFKGHGHEEEDLDTVMTALQHWCHRLYPKFTFDDSLEQIEKLGIQKPVITLKKKIIYNIIDNDDIDMNPDPVDEPVTQIISPPRTVDQFDLLLAEDRPPSTEKEPSPELELSEEQIQIMEKNRLLAAEKRRAKLEAFQNAEKENLQNTSNQDNSEELEMTIL